MATVIPKRAEPKAWLRNTRDSGVGNVCFRVEGTVSFHTDSSAYRLPDKRRVRAWLLKVVEAEGFALGEVAFIFCERERHLEINMEYLGHDYPTDVITFDYTAEGVVSGDIFIDPRTVRENARRFGATAREEMLRVVVHGVLHLCGHGDKSPEEERTMHELEDKYLCWIRL